jgi:hypothetical protein
MDGTNVVHLLFPPSRTVDSTLEVQPLFRLRTAPLHRILKELGRRSSESTGEKLSRAGSDLYTVSTASAVTSLLRRWRGWQLNREPAPG